MVDFGLKIEISEKRICFSNYKNGQVFGSKISEILEQYLSIQNLEKINDDFENNQSASLPFIELLLINCVMSYLEHSTI